MPRCTGRCATSVSQLRRQSSIVINLFSRYLRTLALASCLIFVFGLLISAAIFYRGKSFDPKAAIISDLESPDENPRGYAASALCTTIAALLMAPASVIFYKQLRVRNVWAAHAGALLFTVGLMASAAIGILAPFTRGYTPLHVHLAYAAFIGICGGALFYLRAARAAPALVWFQGVVLAFLIYLYFGPDFNNDHLLTGLAFWEWVLCADCAVAVVALTLAIEKSEPQK